MTENRPRQLRPFLPAIHKSWKPSHAVRNSKTFKADTAPLNSIRIYQSVWKITHLYSYLLCYCYYGVRLCLCGTAAANGPTVHPPDDTWVNIEQRWNDTDRENWRTRRKICPSATLSTTNPKWTNGASAVRDRRLNTWAMARPFILKPNVMNLKHSSALNLDRTLTTSRPIPIRLVKTFQQFAFRMSRLAVR
jgi:hypothetical protein